MRHKHTTLALLAMGLLLQAKLGRASMADLESAARLHAGAVQAARIEREAVLARRDVAQAEGGARLMGGLGAMSAREPVTDTLVRDYRRVSATIGVRWPLLASRLSQKQGVTEAEWDLARVQLNEDMAANDAVRQLRLSAVRVAYAEQRTQLIKRFIASQEVLQKELVIRQKAGYVLNAEVLEFQLLIDAAKSQLARQHQTRSNESASIRRLAGLEAGALLGVGVPAWPEQCFEVEQLMQEDGRGQEAAQQINAAAAVSQMRLLQGGVFNSVEGGVQVAHTQLKDSPGHSGRNTGVSVDFSLPLQWKAQRDGRKGEWSAKRRQAELLLTQARQLRQFDVEKGLRERELLTGEFEEAKSRYAAAQEGLRVALLRKPASDGDGITRYMKVRNVAFDMALRALDAAERRGLAEAQLLALGPQCATLEMPNTTSPWVAPLFRALEGKVPGASPTEANAPAASQSPLAWYVWDAQTLVQHPDRLKVLPGPSGRLLLSFKAEQLRKLKADDLKALKAVAQQRGMTLELLLGDPSWVTDAGRAKLLALLKPVQDLPFDGLNLDLEHSQLPKDSMSTAQWHQGTLDTLQAVRKTVPWPLALTTHHRDLNDAGFLTKLQLAGVTEVVPMVYTQNAARARQVTEYILEKSSSLKVGLAQSIERELSADESSFRHGRKRSVDQWSSLSQALAHNPRFSGVFVQSLAEYEKAKP